MRFLLAFAIISAAAAIFPAAASGQVSAPIGVSTRPDTLALAAESLMDPPHRSRVFPYAVAGSIGLPLLRLLGALVAPCGKTCVGEGGRSTRVGWAFLSAPLYALVGAGLGGVAGWIVDEINGN